MTLVSARFLDLEIQATVTNMLVSIFVKLVTPFS